MGRGRGNSPRSILLGPRPRAAVLPVEPAEIEIPKTFLESTIADFRFNFFSCAQCAKSENRCRCSNPNLETNNQLSPEFLNEIYNINDTLKTGWSSRPKVTIPAGVRIAHFEDKTYTPREENYREKYRDLMKTTQRRSSTGRYQFEIIESRKVWQKPVLTWWSGNNKKSIYVEDIDLKEFGLEGQLDAWIRENGKEALEGLMKQSIQEAQDGGFFARG